MKGAIYPRHPK